MAARKGTTKKKAPLAFDARVFAAHQDPKSPLLTSDEWLLVIASLPANPFRSLILAS
jgi:hypothetical protein